MPQNVSITFRPASASDDCVIREMLYHAIYVPAGEPPPSRSVLQSPDIARYCSNWGRRDDLGWIAEEGGSPVAAVWIRLWTEADQGYGFVDDRTPELSIAVLPSHRGRGIGSRLLGLLIEDARGRYDRISLSVTKTNPARRLYARYGFRETATKDDPVLMVLLLP